jgi:hypothetical protein
MTQQITRRLVVGNVLGSTLALPLAISFAQPARAHHGFTGRYDVTSPFWIEGEVVRAAFAPPHPVITVRLAAAVLPTGELPQAPEMAGALRLPAGAAGQTIEVEFPPVQAFFQLGASVTIGQRVAMVAMRNCLPPHQMRSQWIRTAGGAAGGAVITRPGRMSGQVNGCG